MKRLKVGLLAFVVGLCLGAVSPLNAAPCSPSPTQLCLTAQRFTAEVEWKDFSGNTGSGHAVALTSDTGYFWFFSDTNVELVVKVLDGRVLNGHFWVFYGALSNVAYTLTVRDLQTGDVRVYENPSGRFASTGDTSAFPPDPLSLATAKHGGARTAGKAPIDESGLQTAAPESAAACTAGPTTLCLGGGRFKVAVAWTDFAGNTGLGQAVALTSDTGYFWFFSSANVELVVKALDGRALNDSFWIFYGALSNVAYTLTVTDTVTGIVRTYENPSSLFASVGDTSAFGKPTTFELIDGAVVKGEITDETALLYKVYAYFSDARLPQAYRGDPPLGDPEHGILTDVVARWSTLSEATRQALDPFLLPPIYAGSQFAASSIAASKIPQSLQRADSILADWTRIDSPRAAVWYRAADVGAANAANNLHLEIEKVWTAEMGLMGGQGPLTDDKRNNNGGDDKLDIYVLPSFRTPDPKDKPDGITVPYLDPLDIFFGEPQNIARPAYILIRISTASTPQGARAVLAHEFFHVIALNQKNSDGILKSKWLNEATATWMEDFVYPKKIEINDAEQVWALHYFMKGYRERFDEPDDEGYSDYIFLFYLSHQYDPNLIPAIWNNVKSVSSLKAIDAVIAGGFKERWPEFAMYCWNHPGVDQAAPLSSPFALWDELTSGLGEASAEPHLTLQSGNGTGTILPARIVPHLSMRYAFVEVLSDDIRSLEIQNSPVAGGAANAKTQVWIKLADGTTRLDDWTEKPRVLFCRDKAEENVTGLMILYTNSGQGPSAVWNEGKVIASTVPCGGFRGTVRETRHSTQAAAGQEVDESMDSTATFLPDPGLGGGYYLAAITMVYNFVGHDDATNCTLTIGPVTHTDTFQPADSDLSLNGIVIDTSTQPPTYSATGNYGFAADAKGECPGKPPGTVSGIAGGVWWTVPPGFFPVNPDGSLSGNYTETVPGTEIEWIWKLTPD